MPPTIAILMLGTLTIATLLDDGIIDAEETTQIETELYDDGVIDRDEADAMFYIADEADSLCAEFEVLFVRAICDHLLNDDVSPGAVDDDEGEWLIGKIEGDGEVSDLEKKVLRALKVQAKSLPANLTAKMTEWGV